MAVLNVRAAMSMVSDLVYVLLVVASLQNSWHVSATGSLYPVSATHHAQRKFTAHFLSCGGSRSGSCTTMDKTPLPMDCHQSNSVAAAAASCQLRRTQGNGAKTPSNRPGQVDGGVAARRVAKLARFKVSKMQRLAKSTAAANSTLSSVAKDCLWQVREKLRRMWPLWGPESWP